MRSLAISMVALLTACNATDTGNPVVDGNDEQTEGPGNDNCIEEENEIEFAEPTQLGFSPAEFVAAAIRPDYTSSLAWLEASAVSYGPESGIGEVHVAVEPGGVAHYVTRSPRQQEQDLTEPARAESLAGCADSVRVRATLHLKTAGGAFDESLQVKLDSTTVESAQTRFTIPVDDLGGSFTATAEVPPDSELRSPLTLQFDLTLAAQGMAGTTTSFPEFVGADGSVTEAAAQVIAQFPADNFCGLDALSLTAEQPIRGTSMASALAALNSASPVPFGSDDGMSSTELTATFTPTVQRVCGMFGALLQFPAQARLLSADGRIDGSFPVNITVDSDVRTGMRFAEVHGGAYVQDTSEAAGLSARYGIQDPISLEGYSGASVDFVMIVGDGDGGIFRFYGLRQADCSDPSMNCAGLESIKLWGGHWGTIPFGY